jgi:hypothetical protein
LAGLIELLDEDAADKDLAAGHDAAGDGLPPPKP